MTQHLVQLEDALAAEFQAAREFAALTEHERQALQQDDLSALSKIAREKEQQLAKIDSLEKQREAAAVSWAAVTMPGTELNTLEAVLPYLDPASRQRLHSLRKGIVANLDRAHALNYGNRALLQNALARNAALRDFLLQMAAGPPTYTAPGQPAPPGAQDSYLVDWSG